MLTDFKFCQSNKPLYVKIADCFVDNISRGKIKKGDRMPSINEFSKAYKISRDTVEKGYKILKKKGIITVIKGKGSYVDSTELISKRNVLFFINKLTTYKLEMYNAFKNSIGTDYHTDFEIYNCDEFLFKTLLEKHFDSYDYYIIMPHFKNVCGENFNKESLEIINRIPKEKLIIMDNNELKTEGEIVEIYQDFENDICSALSQGWKKIKNYKRINLVLTQKDSYSYLEKIERGFVKFCSNRNIEYNIINRMAEEISAASGNLYIAIEDNDLVELIDSAKAGNLILGRDVGIISYDETPLKRLLDVAVVSTDFSKMGSTAAEMILSDKKGKINNPFQFIDRASV